MINIDDIAGLAEVAEFMGMSRNSMCNTIKRYDDFPEPVKVIAANRLYNINDVAEWAGKHYRKTYEIEDRHSDRQYNVRINEQDIVGLAEIQNYMSISKAAVVNWALRHEDFPKPIKVLRSGRLYNKVEIDIWFDKYKYESSAKIRHRTK